MVVDRVLERDGKQQNTGGSKMTDSGAEKHKTVMFFTGPVDEVEEQINAVDGTWCPLEYWYHLIDNVACVTVRLIPMAAVRQAQLLGTSPAVWPPAARNRGF